MVLEKLRELLAEQLSVDADSITTETDIIKDLGADSLDIVELMMTFEEEYGVEISDEDAFNLKTIGDIVTYIESKQ
ncbi:MAG: acyl carrier protein [Ruminococcaceae bacterium]|nr:acyl carrier protein [Oscillospiraceae bacterium]